MKDGVPKEDKDDDDPLGGSVLTLPAIPITRLVIARRNIPGTIKVLRPTIYHQPHHSNTQK